MSSMGPWEGLFSLYCCLSGGDSFKVGTGVWALGKRGGWCNGYCDLECEARE